MNLEYILKEVNHSGEIILDSRDIVKQPEFQEGENVASMESLALTLGGHQPIKKFKFSKEKLSNWCDNNDLLFFIDERERLFHLKSK